MKKKILAAIAAMSMMATMSVSALSASAACVHNTDGSCVGNGTFYIWNDADGDGEVDEGELSIPYYHSLDGLINGNPVYNSDDTVTITLQQMTYGNYTGEITYVEDANHNEVDITDGWTLTPGAVYYITIEVAGYTHNPQSVVFVISDCNGCGCGCNN